MSSLDDLPDGHDVYEHDCPDCGATIYTRRRRCSRCQEDYDGAYADYRAEQAKDRGRGC